MEVQIPLGLALKDSATFANFVSGENEVAVHSLTQCAEGKDEPLLYLWGDTGKTHLLQAVCHQASSSGRAISYIPLQQADEFSVDVLQGLESMQLVCIDDLDAISGDAPWEMAVFSLFNRLRDSGTHLVVTARAQPADIGIQLPDLVSRLGWGLVYHLQPLTDEMKLHALQLRADNRGFELPDETGKYLMRRLPRDMHALFEFLDRLDQASMIAQRRITIPFAKEVLGVV